MVSCSLSVATEMIPKDSQNVVKTVILLRNKRITMVLEWPPACYV